MLPRHVYVHVPFCARRCSYCDFAIAVRRVVPANEYVAAIRKELELRLPPEIERPASGSRTERAGLETLYFGGGTPSRLGPAAIERLINVLCERWEIAHGTEVTLEANPEDVTPEAARHWRAAGINRVSLGVQSFNDAVLQWMHRTHDAAQAATAVRVLRDAGFEDWSLDLIFALPPEVERSWADDLARAMELNPPHVSCYGLTVEPHTPLVRWRERGLLHEADEERYEAEFLAADAAFTSVGLDHYEVSNYSLPGKRARHNGAYWRRVPFLGIGPSAHSFDGIERHWNIREFAAWQDALESNRDPCAGTETLDGGQTELENCYLGLRMSDGMHLDGSGLERAAVWERHGWAQVRDRQVRLTPLGWLRLDSLAADLTDLRSRY